VSDGHGCLSAPVRFLTGSDHGGIFRRGHWFAWIFIGHHSQSNRKRPSNGSYCLLMGVGLQGTSCTLPYGFAVRVFSFVEIDQN